MDEFGIAWYTPAEGQTCGLCMKSHLRHATGIKCVAMKKEVRAFESAASISKFHAVSRGMPTPSSVLLQLALEMLDTPCRRSAQA